MAKYIIYIDYAASLDYQYEVISDSDFEEVLEIADDLFEQCNKMGKKVYLMRIMKKDGKQFRIDGYHAEPFKAVLCRRSAGWHRNDEEHAEGKHTVNLCWYNKYNDRNWWVENTTYSN